MATFAIDGLASGLDTTTIINQLVSLERAPATRLQSRITQNERGISALNSLSTRFDSLLELAKDLAVDAQSFVPVIASSSHDSVVATAEASAQLGSFTFAVDSLAATHRLVSGGTTAALTDTVATATSTVQITVDGTAYDVDTGDGSLQALIDNINATDGLNVSAQAVNTGSGLKLQLAATETGADGVFTIDTTNLDGTFAGGMPVLTQGADAQITVGDQAGAYQITSSSNTFTDVVEGVSFTVTEADPAETITVSVEADPDTLVDQVSSFVEAVNGLLTQMDADLKNGLEGTPGALKGNSAVRSLRDNLLNAVTFAVSGSALGSAGLIGIESTREGGLSFDEDAFRDALADNPDQIVELFRSDDENAPGIAQRVESLAERATEFNTGLLDSAVDALEDANRGLKDDIDAIDLRVSLRRTTLERQFSALEVTLQGLQSQQQWLAGAIASMPIQRAQ